jgi:hypothetical protein
MPVCCAECGEKLNTRSIAGKKLDTCKTCQNAEIVSDYLRYMETRRAKHDAANKRAFDQCRELAAWLSVYRFGVEPYRQRGAAYINAWVKNV